MRAGRLRHRIELKSLTEAQNAFGEATKAYATYATVWAEVKPLRGKEAEQAQQVVAEAECQITIRYHASVVETDRIGFDGREFEINSIINPLERNEYLELMCVVVK